MKHLFIGGPLDGQWVETQDSPFWIHDEFAYKNQQVHCCKEKYVVYIPNEWTSDTMFITLCLGYLKSKE